MVEHHPETRSPSWSRSSSRGACAASWHVKERQKPLFAEMPDDDSCPRSTLLRRCRTLQRQETVSPGDAGRRPAA